MGKVLFWIGYVVRLLVLNPWIGTSELPTWVRTAKNRWESKLPIRPYGRRKHFVGKTYVYQIRYKTIEQGVIEELYYKKLRL